MHYWRWHCAREPVLLLSCFESAFSLIISSLWYKLTSTLLACMLQLVTAMLRNISSSSSHVSKAATTKPLLRDFVAFQVELVWPIPVACGNATQIYAHCTSSWRTAHQCYLHHNLCRFEYRHVTSMATQLPKWLLFPSRSVSHTNIVAAPFADFTFMLKDYLLGFLVVFVQTELFICGPILHTEWIRGRCFVGTILSPAKLRSIHPVDYGLRIKRRMTVRFWQSSEKPSTACNNFIITTPSAGISTAPGDSRQPALNSYTRSALSSPINLPLPTFNKLTSLLLFYHTTRTRTSTDFFLFPVTRVQNKLTHAPFVSLVTLSRSS